MAKLLEECIISKQETLYLILPLSIFSYSYEFFRVHLDLNSIEIDISLNISKDNS